ncbi:MAG: ADP compounds hydrolase NudE [Aquisalimonadaceae bacterium]
MTRKPQTLQTKTLARTRFFHVEAVNLRFANGVEVEYERVCSGLDVDAVLIVPMLADGTVLLIREYAAGTDRYELCLPEGRLEQGENCIEAANRELREEAGYSARSFVFLQQLSIAPSYLSHATQVILAQDLHPDDLQGDEPEALEVVPWPIRELPALLAKAELTEARTIAALFLALEHLNAATTSHDDVRRVDAESRMDGQYNIRSILP